MHEKSKKRLTAKLWLLPALLAGAVTVAAQTDDTQKCPAVGGEVPFLSQLSLGMTPEEISKVVNLPIKPEPKKTSVTIERVSDGSPEALSLGTKITRELYAGETLFRYTNAPSKELLGVLGVQGIGLEFYKDRLYSFSMFYQSSDLKWKNAAEFAALASEKFKLPPDFWRVNANVAAVTCRNFHLTANVSAENRVLLFFYDPAILAAVQAEAKRLLAEQK